MPSQLKLDEFFQQIHRTLSKGVMKKIATDLAVGAFDKRVDIFRETPLRFITYGFAVDEALNFRTEDRGHGLFCILAAGNICFHCLYRIIATGEELPFFPKVDQTSVMVIAFCDTFIWEVLASILIPSMITFFTVRATDGFLTIFCNECYTIRKWLPALVGIATIPLFMVSVDRMVDKLMDDTIRDLYYETALRIRLDF